MLHEYAISPQLLKQWAANDRDYNEFFREYGLGSPRIPSAFPKQKASRCRSYFLREGPADLQSSQARRYVEMVDYLVEAVVCRDDVVSDNGEWNSDVVSEDARVPFHVVLSSDQLDTPRSLTPQTMYSRESAWNHPRQMNIFRTTEGFNLAVRDLLRLATTDLVVVDTFGWTQEAISIMQSFLETVNLDRVNSRIPKVTLFYKEKRGSGNSGNGSPTANHVKEQILAGLGRESADIDLQVFELREVGGSDVFHNRCVLTEHGGVITGHGIGVSGDEAHTDEAVLMEPQIYKKKWQQFIEDCCFEVVSQG